MIRGFRRSRIAWIGTLVLAAAIAVAIWIRDRGYPLYIPIVATLLMLALGFVAAKLLGNLIAQQENAKLLGILHVELDPKGFVEAYAPVVKRLKEGSRDRTIASAYLADGYAAAGMYDKALAALEFPAKGKQGEEDVVLLGLYYTNRSGYCLEREDIGEAREAMESLEAVIEKIRLSGKLPLAENLSLSLELRQDRLAVLEGKPVDPERLEDLRRSAQYRLRQLEILKTLAMDAINRENWESAEKLLKSLNTNGGRTCYQSWACRQENRLK